MPIMACRISSSLRDITVGMCSGCAPGFNSIPWRSPPAPAAIQALRCSSCAIAWTSSIHSSGGIGFPAPSADSIPPGAPALIVMMNTSTSVKVTSLGVNWQSAAVSSIVKLIVTPCTARAAAARAFPSGNSTM